MSVIAALAALPPGDDLLDVHSDPHHHRSVFTMVGEDAPAPMARLAVERIDLRRHHGAHPRLGVVDVVPFVPLDGRRPADALPARDAFARWAADELAGAVLPVRTRAHAARDPPPGVVRPVPRRRAARDRHGPAPGATCVGARPVLIAYNVGARRRM